MTKVKNYIDKQLWKDGKGFALVGSVVCWKNDACPNNSQ